ncbi:MAG: hypothetical protein GY865_02875 [candidate division Zixibacteria bacterium]|nr:hypothetical protein [candidate division Zixibacteria bacterium]
MGESINNTNSDNKFAKRIEYELKRAERYRIFVSFLVFDLGFILDTIGDFSTAGENHRKGFINSLNSIIGKSVREVDTVSNGNRVKIGVLCPETSRQGAEAAAKRIQSALSNYCLDHFKNSNDYVIPVEISSFPDAAGNRSIASYTEEYANRIE